MTRQPVGKDPAPNPEQRQNMRAFVRFVCSTPKVLTSLVTLGCNVFVNCSNVTGSFWFLAPV